MWVWQICSSPVNGSHLQSPAFSPGSEWKEEKLIQWNKKTLQIYSFCSFHHFILFQNLSVASPSFIPSWIWAYFYQLISCTGGHTWSRWYFFRDLDLNLYWNLKLGKWVQTSLILLSWPCHCDENGCWIVDNSESEICTRWVSTPPPLHAYLSYLLNKLHFLDIDDDDTGSDDNDSTPFPCRHVFYFLLKSKGHFDFNW